MDKKIVYIILTILIIIIISLISIELTMFMDSKKADTDYQKLDLNITNNYIEYYTVYKKDLFDKYIVYEISDSYSGSGIDIVKEQIEKSSKWSRTKFDEYVMRRFYEEMGRNIYEIDRENLYFYHRDYSNVFAICDIKNAKLYYRQFASLDGPTLDSNVLEIDTKGYLSREVYDVRGGLQYDGTDYYVFEFTQEKGKEIVAILSNSSIWSKEKLDENILDAFKYNEEVMNLENGYYHYKKVCRTSDSYKKEHFTDEEATGYELGVYDPDKNILYYYYWTY